MANLASSTVLSIEPGRDEGIVRGPPSEGIQSVWFRPFREDDPAGSAPCPGFPGSPCPSNDSMETSKAIAIRLRVPARGNSVLPLSIWYRAVREIAARLASSSGPHPFV
jgi:hypothetical protein